MIVGPNIPTLGDMSFFYDPANNRSYSSGTDIHNLRNSITGSLVNGATTSSNSGNSLKNFSLDGSNDWLSTGLNALDIGTTGTTLIFFAKINSLANTKHTIISSHSSYFYYDNAVVSLKRENNTVDGTWNTIANDGNGDGIHDTIPYRWQVHYSYGLQAASATNVVSTGRTTNNISNPYGWKMWYYAVAPSSNAGQDGGHNVSSGISLGLYDVESFQPDIILDGNLSGTANIYRTQNDKFYMNGIGAENGGTYGNTNMEIGPILMYNRRLKSQRTGHGVATLGTSGNGDEIERILRAYRPRFIG